MDRREWYSASDRDFACIYHRDNCFRGGVGLLTFTGLKEPESVDSPEGPLCIAANGYQWLELVPEDGHFALTAMFRGDTLFEQYTDITLRNEVAENGDAAFYDLLLDVVVLSDGTPGGVCPGPPGSRPGGGLLHHPQKPDQGKAIRIQSAL